MSKAKDDKSLYGDGFFDTGWSPAIMASAKAVYGRLNFFDEDACSFEDLDIDTKDSYCIAARHAVRAFMREAEGK